MTAMSSTRRLVELQVWMREHNISIAAVAERMGVCYSSARSYLSAETLPSYRLEELVRLGFPRELLGRPLDRKPKRYSVECALRPKAEPFFQV